jgi:hypothetical protein
MVAMYCTVLYMQARGGQYIDNLRELTAPGQSVRGKVITTTDEATGAAKLRLDFVSFGDSSTDNDSSSDGVDAPFDVEDSA